MNAALYLYVGLASLTTQIYAALQKRKLENSGLKNQISVFLRPVYKSDFRAHFGI